MDRFMRERAKEILGKNWKHGRKSAIEILHLYLLASSLTKCIDPQLNTASTGKEHLIGREIIGHTS